MMTGQRIAGRARRGVGAHHAGGARRRARRRGRRAGQRAGRARAAGAAHAEDGAQPRRRRAAGHRAGAGAQGLRVAALDARLRGRRDARSSTSGRRSTRGDRMATPIVRSHPRQPRGGARRRQGARPARHRRAGRGARGVFDTVWVGDSLLAKPRLESVTLLSALAGVTRARAPGRRLHGDVRPSPSGAAGPAVGEPRRALGAAARCSRCAWAVPTAPTPPRPPSTR